MKTQIVCESAPAAIGPYSQAIKANGMLFISGQMGINQSGNIPDGVTEQAKCCLENIRHIVTEAGGKIENIVKCNVYLKDMNEFAAMNEVYSNFFKAPYPARTTVEVARLPRDIRVEIEAVLVY